MRKLLCGALLLASLAVAPVAGAATVQIGQTAAPGTGNGGGCSNCDDLQASTDPATPTYAVPAGDGGVITAWSVLGAPTMGATGPYSTELLVFRPTSTPGTFAFVAASSSASPPADGQVHTYTTSIVVAPGDVIGLEYTNVPAYFQSGVNAGDKVGNWGCLLNPGTQCAPSDSGGLMSVAATLRTPTAAFTPSATSVAEGTTVSLDGSASTSPGTITDYDWNFGDGATLDTGTTATTTHTFSTPGPHTVSLTITDSNSDTNQAATTITVLSPTPTPTPTTPAATTPFLGSSLEATTLTASTKGVVTLDLVCSSTATTSCNVNVVLYGAAGKTPTTASAHHPKPAVRLGGASFTVTSGGTGVEQIPLNAKGRKLLRKHRRFSARVLLSATDQGGRSVTTLTAVKVKRVANKTRRAPFGAAAASPARSSAIVARFAQSPFAWATPAFH